ncbi:hypothetical protein HYH02_007948 [Chlamydomonas schloesseri]|uniref:PHD-type domain-containing protein n=1 Tax=Chlamydomonas schloesseri TaxID=2026947 RepID=A0A835WGQ5_9CHLO|nr:hypothetical protein HYH02_007948 [Chlamydomonas schloesseri]|eukprot:KAG2447207.1 hypothetical protein HYH02_007948 [Chlamydomonas schloesseri]
MDLHRHLTAARGHRSSRAGQPGAEYDLLACLADAAAVAPQPSSAEPRPSAPSGLAELHPPSSGFGAARISPSPAAEDLIDSVGLSGEREVRVVCNGNYGTFLLPSQTVHCHCARCISGGAEGGAGDGAGSGSGAGLSRQAPAITPTEFERHSGLLTAKKWRNSIRLEAGDGTITIGKWLEQHNILPRPKCSGPPLGSPGPGGSGNVGLLYGLDGGVGGGGYPGPSSGNDSHHTGSHFGLPHGHAVFGGLQGVVAAMGAGGMVGAGAPSLRSTLPPSRYPASEYVTGEDDEYEDGAAAYGHGGGAGAGGHEDDADEDVDYEDGGGYMDADGNHHPGRHVHAAKRAARLAGGHARSRGPIGRAGVSAGPGASGGSQGGRAAMAVRHKSRHGLTHMRRAAAQAAAAAAAGSAGRQRRGSSSQDDGGDKRAQGHTSSEGSLPSDDSKRRPGSGGSGEGDGSGTGDVGDSRRAGAEGEAGIKREDGQTGNPTKQQQAGNQNQARHQALAKRPATDFLAGAVDAAGLASKRARGGRLGPGGMSAEEAAELYDPLSQQPAHGPQIRGWRFLDASAGPAADQVIMSIEINGRTFTGLLAPQLPPVTAGRPPISGAAGGLLPSAGGVSLGRKPSGSRGGLLSSGALARFPGPRSTAPTESEIMEVRPEDDLPFDDGMPADCPRCALCKRCAVPRLALPPPASAKAEAGMPTGAVTAAAALEGATSGSLVVKPEDTVDGKMTAAADMEPVPAAEMQSERPGPIEEPAAVPAADAVVPILTPPEDEQQMPVEADAEAAAVKTEAAKSEMQVDEAKLKAQVAWTADRPSDGAVVPHLPDGPLSGSQPDRPATATAAAPAASVVAAAPAAPEASRTARQTGCGLGPMLQVKCAGASGEPESKLVHSQCALWSNDVFMVAGTLCGMGTAIKRGATRRCAHCGRSGATLCCCSGKCTRAYHLPCAIEAGATLVAEPYAMACPDHKNAAVQHTGCSSQQQGGRIAAPAPRQLRPAASMDVSNTTSAATAATAVTATHGHGASSQPPQQVALPLSLQMSTGRRIVMPPAPATAGSGELPARQGSRSGAASPPSDVASGLPALMMLRSLPTSDSAAAAAALASMPPPRAAGTPGAAAAAAAAAVAAATGVTTTAAKAMPAPAEALGEPDAKSARTSADGHTQHTGEEATAADLAQGANTVPPFESPRGAGDNAAASMAAWLGHAALFARRAAAVAAATGTTTSAEPGTVPGGGLFAGLSSGQAELSVVSDATAAAVSSEQQRAVGNKRPREEEAATEAGTAAPVKLTVAAQVEKEVHPEAAQDPVEAVLAIAAPPCPQVAQPPQLLPQQQQQQRLSLPPGVAVNVGAAAAAALMPAPFLGRNDVGAADDAEDDEDAGAETEYDAGGNNNGGLMLTHDAAMALLEQQQRRMAGIAPDALHLLLLQQQRHPGGGPGGESSVGSPFPAASQPMRGMPGGGGRPRHHHASSAQPSGSLPAHARSAGAAMPGTGGGVASATAPLGSGRPVVRMDSAEELAAAAAAAAAAGHGGPGLMHVLPRAARNIEGLLPSRPLLHNPYVPSSGDPSADLALSKMAQTGSREVEAELLGGTTGRAGHSGRCAVCVIQRKGKCGTESAPKKCLRRQLVALQRASGGGLLGADEHFDAALHLDPALYGADSLTALAAIQQAQQQQQQLASGSQSMGSHQQAPMPGQQQQQQQQQQQSHPMMAGAGSMSSGALNNLGAPASGPGNASHGGEEGHGSDERAAAAAEQRARERARRETWSLPLGQGSGATGKRPPQPYAGM